MESSQYYYAVTPLIFAHFGRPHETDLLDGPAWSTLDFKDMVDPALVIADIADPLEEAHESGT